MRTLLLSFLAGVLLLFAGRINAENVPVFTDEDIQKYGNRSGSGVAAEDKTNAMPQFAAPAPVGTAPSRQIEIPPMVYDKWSSVRFTVLDKIGNEEKEYDVNIGDAFVIPNSDLKIVVKHFIPDFIAKNNIITTNSNEPNNPAVNIIIYDLDREIFKGWLYARFPTLHPVEHSKYQITLSKGIANTLHALSEGPTVEKTIKTKKTISKKEITNIERMCKQVWQRYKVALSKGDIEGALKEVSNNSKDTFRYALQYGRKPEHFGEIRAADIEENIAQFNMTVKDKLLPGDDLSGGHSVGDVIEYEHYVNFVKERNGAWKIDFY